MALITQTQLENAAVDAGTFEDVVNDPTGPFTTRLGQTINFSLAEAIDAITDFSAGVQFTFDPSITMSDPGSGDVRLNNASLASVTQIAISDTDKNANDVAAFVNSWADSTSADKGTIRIMTTNSNVAYYNVTGVTNNTGWTLVDVDYYSSAGSFSSGEKTFLSFSRTGDAGGLTSGGTNTYTGSNTFEGLFSLNGNQSQSIVAQTDDFSLDSTTNVLQIDLTGDQTLTGMTGGVSGRIVVISNVDATDSLTISHLSTSTSTNQFDLPGDVDFVLHPGQSATVKYASSKWELVAQSSAVSNIYGGLLAANQSVIDIASASTVDLGSLTSSEVNITGTTTITSFTGEIGVTYHCRTASSLTLTNGADLALPTSANVVTAAGDTFDIYMVDGDTCIVRNYQRKDGKSLTPHGDFTIIYPNGGSEGSPATIVNNTRYVESNPFSGNKIVCIPEVFFNSVWADPGWFDSSGAQGVRCGQVGDDIIIQTGSTNVVGQSQRSGGLSGTTSASTSATCRVLVWKMEGASS